MGNTDSHEGVTNEHLCPSTEEIQALTEQLSGAGDDPGARREIVAAFKGRLNPALESGQLVSLHTDAVAGGQTTGPVSTL